MSVWIPENGRYGCWAGCPNGRPEDKTSCVAAVGFGIRDGSPGGKQCSRPRGHGPDRLLCKQHAKLDAELKARQARWAKA